MKIVYIASYGPRKCGIATFTGNKFNPIHRQPGRHEHEGMVVAMTDGNNKYAYPPEVKFEISQDKAGDYFAAAKFINESGADICVLEHEFGIFGGSDGAFILSLLHRLKIPVISVLHTVLKQPSEGQRRITKEIIAVSAKTVVMNKKAVEFLTQIYDVPASDVMIIEHGIPDFHFDHDEVKKSFGFAGKNVLLTFGLISRNKGIESALKALPPVIQKHSDTVYIILGKTHPAVLRHSGEEYREYLHHLASELGISQHVIFVDEFTDEKKLFEYLSAADIYITPYLNEAQITSGTLSYAVGAGCAVLSTPYWHAADLLTADKGRLFDFNNAEQLSGILNELLGNPSLMNALRKNSREYGLTVTWPKIGDQYLSLAQKIADQQLIRITGKENPAHENQLPAFSLDHIRRMTDSTGLIQHSKYGIPNLKEGYCLDDNARGLLMATMAYRSQKHLHALDLLPVYLGYIHYMQNDDGTFRNFLSFSRNFLDEQGSEDSFGRTIWALGYLLHYPPNDMYCHSAKEIFLSALPNFEKLESVRGISNTILGISHYLLGAPEDEGIRNVLRNLTDKLLKHYSDHSVGNWKWFEQVLTYDNAVMPLALFLSYEVLADEKILQAAMESMQFLSGITLRNGYLSVVGNEKWFARDEHQSIFAQQPVDVMMMVLMFQKVYEITENEFYISQLRTSFMWFFGENDMQVQLYDKETKGCFDGLESYGVNKNRGAESTLAYLISYLVVNEVAEINSGVMSNSKAAG